MRPVLFEVLGFPVNSYGVSKAAAALIAGWLLAREFRRLGWDPDRAWSLALWATLVGFVGGKLYYLAENLGNLSPHAFGTSGFTWYGGLIAGVLTVMARTPVAPGSSRPSSARPAAPVRERVSSSPLTPSAMSIGPEKAAAARMTKQIKMGQRWP